MVVAVVVAVVGFGPTKGLPNSTDVMRKVTSVVVRLRRPLRSTEIVTENSDAAAFIDRTAARRLLRL